MTLRRIYWFWLLVGPYCVQRAQRHRGAGGGEWPTVPWAEKPHCRSEMVKNKTLTVIYYSHICTNDQEYNPVILLVFLFGMIFAAVGFPFRQGGDVHRQKLCSTKKIKKVNMPLLVPKRASLKSHFPLHAINRTCSRLNNSVPQSTEFLAKLCRFTLMLVLATLNISSFVVVCCCLLWSKNFWRCFFAFPGCCLSTAVWRKAPLLRWTVTQIIQFLENPSSNSFFFSSRSRFWHPLDISTLTEWWTVTVWWLLQVRLWWSMPEGPSKMSTVEWGVILVIQFMEL